MPSDVCAPGEAPGKVGERLGVDSPALATRTIERYIEQSRMPRRRNQQEVEEPSTPPGGWRVLEHDDPDAWPLLVAFDLE